MSKDKYLSTFLLQMEAIVFSILQMENINLLLTERGILARGRDSTDRVSRDRNGGYCV